MSSRPVQRVGAGAEFRVPGEQTDVVREGVQAFAEDLLGGVVVVVVVLGHVSVGECEEEPGVGPVCGERAPCGGPRLGRPADGDKRVDLPPYGVTHVVIVVVQESPPLVQQAGRARPRAPLSPVPEFWSTRNLFL